MIVVHTRVVSKYRILGGCLYSMGLDILINVTIVFSFAYILNYQESAWIGHTGKIQLLFK